MIRPLKKVSSGYYESADGKWFFFRDDEGYRPTPQDFEAGARATPKGRRWDIGEIRVVNYGRGPREERIVVDTARTLGEAVAYVERPAAGDSA